MALTASILKARHALRALQHAPEPVRRRWQRVASAAAFLVVVAGWVFYLNASLGPAERPGAAETKTPGFFETLEMGFDAIGSTLSTEWGRLRAWGSSTWSGLDAQVLNPSVFTFVRDEEPFMPAPYEPVPPQILPVE